MKISDLKLQRGALMKFSNRIVAAGLVLVSLIGTSTISYSKEVLSRTVSSQSSLRNDDQGPIISGPGDRDPDRVRIQDNFRFYQPGTGEHFITSSRSEGSRAGYRYEGVAFRSFENPPETEGLTEVFRCYYGKHFVSNDPNCEGTSFEGSLGFIFSDPLEYTTPLYRFYHPGIDDHLITISFAEGENAGYQFEGILGYVDSE
jgi:hypothetical protein